MSKYTFIPENAPLLLEDRKKYQHLKNLFATNGYDPRVKKEDDKVIVNYKRLKFDDLMKSTDLVRFVPKVVKEILVGSIEPRLVVASKLFKTINLEETIYVSVDKFGPLEAEILGEGGTFKNQTINYSGTGEMVQPVRYDKVGVQFAFTNESKAIGAFDVISLMVKEAGKALARKKEELAMAAMEVGGTNVFNNINPSLAYFGATSGRNLSGAFNGTISLNDIIKMNNYLFMRKFNPTTLLVHPLSWMVIATSPDTREIILNGNSVVSQPTPQGDNGVTYPNSFGDYGLNTEAGTGTTEPDDVFGKIGYNPFVQSLNPLTATWHYTSDYLPNGIEILVSPFVKFTLDANIGGTLPTCDLYMVDSNAAGVIIQTQQPKWSNYEDWFTEVEYMKLTETYGAEVLKQGGAIVTAKGVVVDRNYVFENVNSVTITSDHPDNTPLATE